jgi:hypothetical protein
MILDDFGNSALPISKQAIANGSQSRQILAAMPVLQKSTRKIIQTAAKADGVDLETIAAALAVLEGGRLSPTISRPLAVNQAEAGRLLSVPRFMIRNLVAQGRLKPIKLTEGCVRYPLEQLEKLFLTT